MAYYDITGADLKEAAKAAYALSSPRGLGFLNSQKGSDLSDDEAQALVDRERAGGYCALGMDYVNGRSCKFYVNRVGDRLFTNAWWYDHTEQDMQELLASIGKTDAPLVEDFPAA